MDDVALYTTYIRNQYYSYNAIHLDTPPIKQIIILITNLKKCLTGAGTGGVSTEREEQEAPEPAGARRPRAARGAPEDALLSLSWMSCSAASSSLAVKASTAGATL